MPPHATNVDFVLQRVTGQLELMGQIGGATYAVAVQGSYTYIGVGPRLVILNISDPAHPAVVGQTAPLPGIVESAAVAGNYAYIADGNSGLRIIDVANPPVPIEVGACDTPGRAGDVVVTGNYAYVADLSGGLRIINIANPAAPIEIGAYDDQWQDQAATYSADISLGQGYHRVRLEYYEGSGSAAVRLGWERLTDSPDFVANSGMEPI